MDITAAFVLSVGVISTISFLIIATIGLLECLGIINISIPRFPYGEERGPIKKNDFND